jgi:hypothetical protein
MATIRRVFTYTLADDYLAQTADLNKSAQWTYVGPDELWIYVLKETGKPRCYNFFTKEMDGDIIPTPEDCIKYYIDANVEPLLATLIGASEYVDGNTLPQHSEILPNGETYSRPLNPMPDHTYEISEMYYDFDKEEWVFPWKKTWVEWPDLIKRRDESLRHVELMLRKVDDYPPSIVTKLQTFKTELENLETTWAGYPAYKVWLPVPPQ